GQRLSAPSVRAGGVVNTVVRAEGASVCPDGGWWWSETLDWFVPAETDGSVMPVSSQVSMVPRADHGNRGVLL
ncbi:hypothetical protein ABZ402_52495, partial [Streptomyces mirabilis]|uniref:hypothetical protein n=1 Tax=Streptomyces mirabilis TaxID=68239 RepID=UPI0033C150C6